MLQIRPEQMKVFEVDVQRRFIEDLIAVFSTSHAAVLDLKERVHMAVRRARACGILAWGDPAWFVGLDLQRGAGWETKPWMERALEVLDAAGTDVADRRFRLVKRLQRWGDYGR